MKKLLIILSFVGAVASILAFHKSRPSLFFAKEKLSEYGFFTGRLADLKPAENIIPYHLNSALFSNYAEKLRFISIPKGEKAIFNPDTVFSLPVGTILIKNFYYPNDFRNPSAGRKIIETRLLVHEAGGWNALPYIWNDEQTEAYYDVAGDTKKIKYIDHRGKKIETDYFIPNKNQCKGCHASGDKLIPIGIAARHLNRDYPYREGTRNQLLYWAEKGMLEGMPALESVAGNSQWEDQKTGTLENRARAYLDINCGHCHKRSGAANTSGLFLDISTPLGTSFGIMKTPVAAGRGSGNLDYDIVPGHPEKSILVFRMNTTDPGIAMPELGREQIHHEAIDLVSQWIKSLKP